MDCKMNMPYDDRRSAQERSIFFCPRLRDDILSLIPFCHVLTLYKRTGLHVPRTVDTVLIHSCRAKSCPLVGLLALDAFGTKASNPMMVPLHPLVFPSSTY
jgi:hypothetical protein